MSTPAEFSVYWQVKATRRSSGLEVAIGYGSTPEAAWESMLKGIENKSNSAKAKVDEIDSVAAGLARLERPHG